MKRATVCTYKHMANWKGFFSLVEEEVVNHQLLSLMYEVLQGNKHIVNNTQNNTSTCV